MSLSPANGRAFDLLVDTILPAVPGEGAAWTTPGAELGLSAGLPGVYEALPHDRDRKDLTLFLGLLDSAAGGLVLFGRAKKFTEMPPDQRAAALLAMEGNRVEIVRKGVTGTEDTCRLPVGHHRRPHPPAHGMGCDGIPGTGWPSPDDAQADQDRSGGP